MSHYRKNVSFNQNKSGNVYKHKNEFYDQVKNENRELVEKERKIAQQNEDYFKSDEYKDKMNQESQRINLSHEYRGSEVYKHARNHIHEQKIIYNHETKMMAKNGIKETRDNRRDNTVCGAGGIGSSGFGESGRTRINPVDLHINKFKDYANTKFKLESIEIYLTDIKLYNRNDASSSVKLWCFKEFNWYPEINIGDILLSSAPLSNSACKRHVATAFVSDNGDSRFTKKSSICLPHPYAMHNLHNYFLALRHMLRSSRRVISLKLYYEFIAISIIRLACPSINMNAFTEFMKLFSKVKMLESLIVAESLLYDIQHQDQIFSISLMVERIWNELNIVGQDMAINGENYIGGFTNDINRKYSVIRTMFLAVITKFSDIFQYTIDFDLCDQVMHLFWGNKLSFDKDIFYTDSTKFSDHDKLINIKVIDTLNTLAKCDLKHYNISDYVVSGDWIRFPDQTEKWNRQTRNVRLSSILNFFQINGRLESNFFKRFPEYRDPECRDFEHNNLDTMRMIATIKEQNGEKINVHSLKSDNLREFSKKIIYTSRCEYNRWAELNSDYITSKSTEFVPPKKELKSEEILNDQISIKSTRDKIQDEIQSTVAIKDITIGCHILPIQYKGSTMTYGVFQEHKDKDFNFPGGKLEHDERLMDCLFRELEEELTEIPGCVLDCKDLDFAESKSECGTFICKYIPVDYCNKYLTYLSLHELINSHLKIAPWVLRVVKHFENSGRCTIFRNTCHVCSNILHECKCSTNRNGFAKAMQASWADET